MTYKKGDEITFHNAGKVLTGWVDSDEPVTVDDEIVGYMVGSPEFQGIVRVENIIEE